MLDPKLLRDNPDKIRNMLEARAVKFPLDDLISLDKYRRELITKTDEFRKKKNEVSLEIARKKKVKEDASNLIDQMQIVSDNLRKLEEDQIKIEEKFTKLSLTLPNMIHESVPIGKDETANKEIKKWGDIPIFDFEVKDHIDLTQSLDLVDLERAAKVSGARFYYLKNQLVRLNQALLQFALDFLSEKNYIPIQTPFLINRAAMEGAIIAQDFEDVIYKIEGEDLYLIGTSEHAVASMHSDEIIDGKKLPLRYAGVSTCFRKEAGAHGRDQKGIFRVHQFEKVEQFVFTRPEDSWHEHERMLAIAEEFYQKIGIPYRIILLSSVDLGKVSAKTYDLEAWMTGQRNYREIVSCSNCLDFQARRLKIRFRDRTDEQPQYLHSLNSTLVATTRTMVAIIENFQTRDGHITVPKALQKYVGSSLI
ncbi:MAG: serine--tRNA ligase [Thaumarchaeota archaeon]|nr:serine--tRNA ligase [Nitrososphaerota archaeon]MDE1831582.1 serine--tRNA ligase [Nitrososphaerota archaeon]MDE1841543.1 serine--tRNA ligase [Nitrososphaerota archaeon]MDE1877991.1 serine--tRNA ligase [Nitrososphaerota archaeon]